MQHRQLMAMTVVLGGVAAALAGCRPRASEQSVENAAAAQPAPRAALPITEPPIDRAELLQAVAQAATATALGRDDRRDQLALDGKRFEVRIRFGCAGAAATTAPATGKLPFEVRFGSADRTLRVRAAPDLTIDDPWIAALAGESVEAVEGFWMRRPWLLTDGCPAVPPRPVQAPAAPGPRKAAPIDVPASVASGQRVGLARFFTQADPRTDRRRERAYEATKVLDEGQQVSPQGYNLVLSGRLRQLPGGRVITCQAASADAPPDCVVAAGFDRVWIEHPDTRAVVAEWTS